eukprot:1067405-Pyramimonas_sp.AAC.1
MLEQGLRDAVERFTDHGNPLASIRGPFSACAATALRLRISMQGFVRSHPRRGEVSILQSGPRTVRKWLHHVVLQWLWEKVASREGVSELSLGCNFQLLQSPLASKGLRHDEKAYLRRIVAGGQWPQHRPWLSQYAADPLCRLCQQAPGALLHRHASCAGRDDIAAQEVPPDFLASVVRAS